MALGIDPGPTWCGWALLDFAVSTAPVWHMGGRTDDVPALLDTLVAAGPLRPAVVGVERPVALHNPLANVQAMATCFAAGEVCGEARARGFEVMALPVHEWRGAFVGHFAKRGENVDHTIERTLRALVRQMPKVTSTHSRDAAGVACVAHRKWRQRPGQVRAIGGET